MKKFLSLVTVSAGAKDFNDNSKINYKEAVDVMSAVGVIDGYPDGTFNPSNTLTRGAAAKIICNLILGPTTAGALVADAAPYKDVPTNNTFAGYIAYCQKEGIISGYADGTFKPANSLTGYAFMKMLLGALGYKAEQEGYTGPNWSIQVAKRAMNIGLKDGLIGDFNGVKAVNREEACLYAFNTLQATMVEYEKNSTVTVGNITIKDTSDAKEMTCVKGSGNDGNIDLDGKVQFAEKYFTDLKLEEGSDDFGRPANTWKVKKDEVGTYANRGDLVATYTKKATKADIYSAVGKTVYDDLTDVKDPALLTVWFDGQETVVSNVNDVDSYIEKNNTGASNGTANGDLTEVYVDDDNNVTIVTIRTYVFQAAADYDSKKEQINLTTDSTKYDTDITLDDRTVSLDDYAVIKDLKEDDYVLVTAVVNKAGKYEIKSVEKAETKTAEVTGYKYQDSVTAGSDTYKYSATAKKNSGIKDTQYNVGKQATLVFDKYGYIIAVEESVVLSDYVFISEFGHTSSLNSKAVANAVFPDGTDAEIVVKEAFDGTKQETNKTTISGWNTAKAGWYTYSKNSDNEYTLYAIESKYAPTNDTTYDYDTGDRTVSVNSKVAPFVASTAGTADVSGVLANDDTVVVVNDTKGDYTVYTGVKNFPGITMTAAGSTAKVYTIHKTNGYAALIYIDVTGSATITGDKNSNLVYVISYDGKYVTTDNETLYKYTVLNGEDEEKVEADNVIQSKLGDVYQVANYLTKNKDRLTDFQLVSADDTGVVIGGVNKNSTASNMAIAQSAGTLIIGGQKYLVAEDAKITLVTLNSANAMNKDKDADYEVSANMTASELVNALKGYDYTYSYGGKLTENKAANGNTIKELYVTITAATETVAPASTVDVKFVGYSGMTYINKADGTTPIVLDANDVVAVAEGSDFQFTLAPVAGKAVKSVKAGSTTLTPDANGVYTVKVTADTTITLTFDDVQTVTFAGSDCRIEVNGKTYKAGDTLQVVKDAEISMNIKAADGKNITKVEADSTVLSGFGGVYDYTVNADVTITVTVA